MGLGTWYGMMEDPTWDTLRMEKNMDGEGTTLPMEDNLGETFIKASGKMIKSTEKAFILGLTILTMKVIFRMESSMEKEHTFGQIKRSIRVSGRMTRKADMEFSFGPVGLILKEIGLMELKMDQENTLPPKERS